MLTLRRLIKLTPLLAAIASALGCASTPQRLGLGYQPPFLLPDQTVASSFEPTDFGALYDRLHRQYPARGEFETSVAYRQRIAAGVDTTLYVFRTHLSWFGMSYHADDSRLAVDMEGGGLSEPDFVAGKALGALCVNLTSKSSSGYVGSNAFGATVDVRSHDAKMDAIVPLNISAWPWLFVTCTPDFAMRVKGGTKEIWCLCRLAQIPDSPVAFDASHYREATFDSPSESFTQYRCVTVRLLEVWFMDEGKHVLGTVRIRQ